jgi:phosphopantetheinyl transferase
MEKKIGFDMEWTKSLKLSELEEIAPMIMSESESRKFMATTGAERINLFFEQFSSKESIIKAFGTGLHYDVRTIDTTAEGTVYCFDSLNFEQKYLGPFRDEYVMSICYQT